MKISNNPLEKDLKIKVFFMYKFQIETDCPIICWYCQKIQVIKLFCQGKEKEYSICLSCLKIRNKNGIKTIVRSIDFWYSYNNLNFLND